MIKKIFTPGKIILLIICFVISLNWYSKINHIVYTKDEIKTVLTKDEVKSLISKGIYQGKTDYAKYKYWTIEYVKYEKTRSLIPYIFKTKEISRTNKEYWIIEK